MFFGILLSAISAETDSDPDSSSDYRFVLAAQRGSADAFATLHLRYYNRIYKLAFLKTGNVTDAEDVAAETFVRAFSSLPRYRFPESVSVGRHSLYPWLHRIACNLIVDAHRKKPASQLSLDAPTIEGMRDLLMDRITDSDHAQTPHEIVERHEVQAMVRAAINNLPQDQADVLMHRFIGELSLKEIAPLLNRSESAVKSLLHRAVVALRDDLFSELQTLEDSAVTASQSDRNKQETSTHVTGRFSQTDEQ